MENYHEWSVEQRVDRIDELQQKEENGTLTEEEFLELHELERITL
ncbi:hypothetical protein [Laceyella putida]|uniref:SHOCT domain-containing protein n=1 Tax=Laceyella putida TaxID=110101 RepID=A0ABW2RQZ5_9BACL